MRFAGFVLLLAGWIIVLAAVALLRDLARNGFALAGIAVELLGLIVVIHSQLKAREELD